MIRFHHYHLSPLLPLFAALLTTTSPAREAAALQPGAPVDFAQLAIQPKAWEKRGLSLQLTPWTGKHVVFLTVDDTLDPVLIGRWVANLDAGWGLYRELTGRDPRPFRQIGGKATIAAVPGADLTCGLGCGYVGATGVELAMFYNHNYPQLKTHPKAMPHYVFYEMGRNYYTFGDRHSCFITGFAVFMRYVCMDTLGFEDTDAGTRKVIEGLEPRFAASGMNFVDLFTTSGGKGEKAHAIKDDQGEMISPSDQPCRYTSAMQRLHREHGGDAWLKSFFLELATAAEVKPNTPADALNQGWYWLLSASVAARQDLSPVFADEWKLPLNPATRAALAKIDWKKSGLSLKQVAAAVTPGFVQDEPPATR